MRVNDTPAFTGGTMRDGTAPEGVRTTAHDYSDSP